jgi:hypothetical protein
MHSSQTRVHNFIPSIQPIQPFDQSQLQLPTSQIRPLTTLGERTVFAIIQQSKRASKKFRKETSKKPTCFFETLQLKLKGSLQRPYVNLSIHQRLSPLSSPLLWPQQRTTLGLLALTTSSEKLAASKGGLESTHQVGQA